MQTSISRVFCFGLGYLANHVVSCLQAENSFFDITEISGTTRKPSREKEFLFDDTYELSDAACDALQRAQAVLVTIPPDEDGDKVFRLYKDFLSYLPDLQWVGYCSSTAVYGDHRGGWVNEETPVNPLSLRAQRRVKAEQQWLNSDLPVHIFRLGGIYGSRRSALELARSRMPILTKPDHVMNRIHVVDAARAICASMARPQKNAIYNLCDDLPASREEVMRYAYAIQELPAPDVLTWDQASLSPLAREFFEENKRVRTEFTKTRLGLEWLYPDYRSGLDMVLKTDKEAPASGQANINDNTLKTRHQIAE